MPIVPERVKSAYQRHWPSRPIPDPMSRNFRMMERRGSRLLVLLLVVLLLTTIVEIAC